MRLMKAQMVIKDKVWGTKQYVKSGHKIIYNEKDIIIIGHGNINEMFKYGRYDFIGTDIFLLLDKKEDSMWGDFDCFSTISEGHSYYKMYKSKKDIIEKLLEGGVEC